MENFNKPAHMGAPVFVGQIDIHVYVSDGRLKSVFAVPNGDRVAKIFDANFVNRYFPVIPLVL
jgi:hypothetical protein